MLMSKAIGKNDAKTRLRKFLEGQAIELTSEEEKILSRWQFANDLLEKKQHEWSDIRDKIVDQFKVSRFTAENDIVNTQDVFGTNRKINKRFLIHLHLDRIDRDIERLRKGMFFETDPKTGVVKEVIPDAKMVGALEKLYEAYTYAINSAPVDDDRTKLPPPIYMFNLPDGVKLPVPDIALLLKAADEFIDFETIPHEHSQPLRPASAAKNNAGTSHDDPADQS